jgi:hypothetical protein
VVEVLTNGQVEAYLNDVQFVPVGCTSLETCNLADVLAGLHLRSAADAKTTCYETDRLITK